MNRSHPHHGAPGPAGEEGRIFNRARARGFTLLEMCIVLLIIALLLGVTLPALHTAFEEQAVRRDSHQLALMVKTAMIQTSEQHRPYVIDLSGSTLALHPLGATATATTDTVTDANLFADSGSTVEGGPTMDDVTASDNLDSLNKLLAPDTSKPDAWIDMPDGTSWVFQPGELCPATRVRLSRGDSWLEMSFNALTGNVEKETTYFP
jgi:prepilin-type N-terminal cleavage/methylation domain-containing protein